MQLTNHRSRPKGSTNPQHRKEFDLPNSRVIVEDGPALAVRIEHTNRVEWGYVDPQTLKALEEVA